MAASQAEQANRKALASLKKFGSEKAGPALKFVWNQALEHPVRTVVTPLLPQLNHTAGPEESLVRTGVYIAAALGGSLAANVMSRGKEDRAEQTHFDNDMFSLQVQTGSIILGETAIQFTQRYLSKLDLLGTDFKPAIIVGMTLLDEALEAAAHFKQKTADTISFHAARLALAWATTGIGTLFAKEYWDANNHLMAGLVGIAIVTNLTEVLVNMPDRDEVLGTLLMDRIHLRKRQYKNKENDSEDKLDGLTRNRTTSEENHSAAIDKNKIAVKNSGFWRNALHQARHKNPDEIIEYLSQALEDPTLDNKIAGEIRFDIALAKFGSFLISGAKDPLIRIGEGYHNAKEKIVSRFKSSKGQVTEPKQVTSAPRAMVPNRADAARAAAISRGETTPQLPPRNVPQGNGQREIGSREN